MANQVLDGYSLLVSNGKIVQIDLESKINSSTTYETIDGQGLYLSPGFIDIHNHGNSGYDFMDGTKEALDRISNYHLDNGTTSFLATIISQSYDNMIEAALNIKAYDNKDYSQLLGIHLEGPFFSMDKKGAQPGDHIKEPDLNFIEKIHHILGKKLVMVSLAPEKQGALELISYLKDKGIKVTMAHSNASYDETILAINRGLTIASHLYNGMRPFNHREPGIIGGSLTDDRVYCEIIYDRVHLHDVAVEIALRMKGKEKIVLVSDSMRAAGLVDGIYDLGGQKVTVKEGVARLEDYSLAGSTLNLRTGVYNMVKYMKRPLHEAVHIASLSPASAIGIERKKGSIDIGKDADLIVFDDHINIKSVIIGGRRRR